jgi:Tfp pilus assembly protein PilO
VTKQQLQRVLALSFGLLVVALVLYWAFGKYQSMFTTRETRLTKLRKEVADRDRTVAVVHKAIARKRELEKRSLPTDAELARSLYHNWLLGIVDGVKLTGAKVGPGPVRATPTAYQPYTFTVSGDGTLDQIARLLYEFYSTNHLHRISRLDIKPVEKSTTLHLIMDVEAISLPGTKRKDTLTKEPGQNLALASISDYQKAITGRNLFAEYVPPAPPTKTEERKDPAFDIAKLAFVTAFMEGTNRRREIWLHERNLNKTTKLAEGDPFEVGPIKGTVKRIHYESRQVEMDINGKTLSLTMNKSLGDALAEQQKTQ